MQIIDLTKRSANDPAVKGGTGQFCLINVSTTKTGGAGAATTANVEFSSSFALPMPQNVRRDYSADWNIDSTGLTERVLTDAINRVKNIVNKGENTTDKNAPTTNIKSNAVNELVKIAQGTAFRQSARNQGLAFNPHKELFYSGPAFRSHPLEFKFSFVKAADAEAFNEMLKLLAAAMSPEYEGSSSSGVWKIPDTFYIDYVNAKTAKIPPCVLTSIQTNLTEAGVWKAFKDGNPAHVSLALTFLELAPLTKSDILQKGM